MIEIKRKDLKNQLCPGSFFKIQKWNGKDPNQGSTKYLATDGDVVKSPAFLLFPSLVA